MVVWVEQGWLPRGNWNLPAEFEHPDKFAFTSDRAQFMLEQGGFSGYGAAPSRRLPTGRVDVHSKAQFDRLLNDLRVALRERGQSGAIRTEVHRAADPEGNPIVNTHYGTSIGPARQEYQAAWSQVSDPSRRAGGFYGQVEFGILQGLERMHRRQFRPAGAATPRAARPDHRAFRGYSGYGEAVSPIGWRRFRHVQGRGARAMGYRGYGMSTLTWDEYANRLSVP